MSIGNPRAGAPDTALLNFLFQQRQAERRDQLDQLKFISSAKAEKRADEKAKLGDIKAKLEIADLVSKAAVGISEAQNLAKSEFTDVDLANPPPVVGHPGSVFPGSSFRSIVQRNDPPGVARAGQADQLVQDRVRQAASVRSALSGGTPQQSVDSVLGAASSFELEEKRQSQIALDKTIDQEDRANLKSIKASGVASGRSIKAAEVAGQRSVRAASVSAERAVEAAEVADRRAVKAAKTASTAGIVAATRASERSQIAADRKNEQVVSRTVDVILDVNEAFVEELAKVKSATTPEERQIATLNFKSLRDEKLRSSVAHAPGALVAQRADSLKKKSSYRALIEQLAVVRLIAQHPEWVGVDANVSRVVKRLKGIGIDLDQIWSGSSARLSEFIESSTFLDDEDKNFLRQTVFIGEDKKGIAIERTRLEEIRLVWSLLMSMNPSGRQLKGQVELLRQVIGFTGFWTSSAISIDRLNAASGLIVSSFPRLQQDLKTLEPWLEFDRVTGEISGDIPINIIGLEGTEQPDRFLGSGRSITSGDINKLRKLPATGGP